MGKNKDLLGYHAFNLMSHNNMDKELRRLYDSHQFHGYLVAWADHTCPDHENCSKFFVLDGNLKLSHPICACAIGSEGSVFYECYETGPIPIGCPKAPQLGQKLCADCALRLQVIQGGEEVPDSQPSDGKGEDRVDSSDAESAAIDEVVDMGKRTAAAEPSTAPRRSSRTRRPPQKLDGYKTDTGTEIIDKVLDTTTSEYDAGESLLLISLVFIGHHCVMK